MQEYFLPSEDPYQFGWTNLGGGESNDYWVRNPNPGRGGLPGGQNISYTRAPTYDPRRRGFVFAPGTYSIGDRPSDNSSFWGDVGKPWAQGAAEFAPYAAAMYGGVQGLSALAPEMAGAGADVAGSSGASLGGGLGSANSAAAAGQYGLNAGSGAAEMLGNSTAATGLGGGAGLNAAGFDAGLLGVPTSGAAALSGMALGSGLAGAGAAGAGAAGSGAAGGSVPSNVLGTTAGAGLAGAANGLLSNAGLATAAGALLGAAGGSARPAGTTTTSETKDLPAWQLPYVQQGLSDAQQIYAGMPKGRVDPLTQSGYDYQRDVIGGKYLDNNPYLDQMFGTASQRVTDAYSRGTAAQTDAAFARSGAFGDSAYRDQTQANQRALGDSLDKLSADIYGGNYQQERARQQQSATTAPDYSTAFLQQPLTNTNAYLQAVGRSFGSQGTQTQPYFQNPVGGALSGALAGYGISRAFG